MVVVVVVVMMIMVLMACESDGSNLRHLLQIFCQDVGLNLTAS